MSSHNIGIIDRIDNNTINKQERAKKEKQKEVKETRSKILEFRTKDTYIDDSKKLNDKLINSNAGDIRNNVKKVKIKK